MLNSCRTTQPGVRVGSEEANTSRPVSSRVLASQTRACRKRDRSAITEPKWNESGTKRTLAAPRAARGERNWNEKDDAGRALSLSGTFHGVGAPSRMGKAVEWLPSSLDSNHSKQRAQRLRLIRTGARQAGPRPSGACATTGAVAHLRGRQMVSRQTVPERIRRA